MPQPDAAPGTLEATAEAASSVSAESLDEARFYREFAGLRALILRRVGDPDLAADIVQDAAVTTLQKLRSGAIARPEEAGGYFYRVALNHLRNHRRKDRSAVTESLPAEELEADDERPAPESVQGQQWAQLARQLLEEMPVARDRELLVRFYLEQEDRESLCSGLGLTAEHFNRVIFRARARFRELLEQKGYRKVDLFSCGPFLLLWPALTALPGPSPPSAPVERGAPDSFFQGSE